MEYILEQSQVWIADPVRWGAIFLLIGFVSMIIHELGHAYFVRLVGGRVLRLDFGKPAFRIYQTKSGCELRLGLPLGGSCYWSLDSVGEFMSLRMMPIHIGGWVFDLLSLIFIKFVFDDGQLLTGIGFMMNLYICLKVFLGITPLTSDGRKLVHSMCELVVDIIKYMFTALRRYIAMAKEGK